MIADLLLGLLDAVINLLPGWTPVLIDNAWITDLFDLMPIDFSTYLVWADAYVPLREAIDVVGILLLLYAAVWLYRLIVWVYSKIPFKAT